MSVHSSDSASGARPFRPNGAKWHLPRSLRFRLALFVGLGVAGVVALLSILQVRLVEQTVERQLVGSASGTAQAVANGMRSVDDSDMPGWLHDFIEAEPAVRSISIVALDGPDASVSASTS